MEKKDLVEGMRLYIYKLRVDGRYSTAKSYQDALNSFMRYYPISMSIMRTFGVIRPFC